MARRRRGSDDRVCEPPTHSWCTGSAASASARRTGRALLRTPVRDGPDATDPPARPLEHPEAAPDSQRRLQPGTPAPQLARGGHAAGPPGPYAGPLGLLTPPRLGAQGPLRTL